MARKKAPDSAAPPPAATVAGPGPSPEPPRPAPSPPAPLAAEAPDLEPPNAGELDVYSVLYAERAVGPDHPLQLSEVFRRVCERRRRFGEVEPALTTISTHLRSLVRKKLADETTARSARPSVRTRGGLTPPTRSPLTSYRARHTPGVVLHSTFRGLAETYPDRLDALVDFGQALGLSVEALRRLAEVVAREKQARDAAQGPAGAGC